MRLFQSASSFHKGSANNCAITLGTYKGDDYRTTGTIGSPQCLIESKFLKVQLHHVQLENGAAIIDDWIWIDYHDRVNVLIEAPKAINEKDQQTRFLVFEQTKYALEGRFSLAVMGGIIEPGEEPETSARREVLEETSHVCNQWQFLGRYRTDVNRGNGWTNTYLARDCQKQQTTSLANQDQVDQVGAADLERQDLRIMTLNEIQKAVQAGQFLEIQWSATVALAVLYYQQQSTTGS